jgi:hypothetical protein
MQALTDLVQSNQAGWLANIPAYAPLWVDDSQMSDLVRIAIHRDIVSPLPPHDSSDCPRWRGHHPALACKWSWAGPVARDAGPTPDRLSDALRIRAVQRPGMQPCLTRSARLPIRVERRQKAKMITDMGRSRFRNASSTAFVTL